MRTVLLMNCLVGTSTSETFCHNFPSFSSVASYIKKLNWKRWFHITRDSRGGSPHTGYFTVSTQMKSHRRIPSLSFWLLNLYANAVPEAVEVAREHSKLTSVKLNVTEGSSKCDAEKWCSCELQINTHLNQTQLAVFVGRKPVRYQVLVAE